MKKVYQLTTGLFIINANPNNLVQDGYNYSISNCYVGMDRNSLREGYNISF